MAAMTDAWMNANNLDLLKDQQKNKKKHTIDSPSRACLTGKIQDTFSKSKIKQAGGVLIVVVDFSFEVLNLIGKCFKVFRGASQVHE